LNVNKCLIGRLALFLSMCALVGLCACAPVPRAGVPLDSIEASLNEASPLQGADEIPLPPPEVRAALIPLPERLSEVQQQEERFDIAATDVAAREFFMSLVSGSDANMIVHPKVSGTINVDLKNTTIDEVLKVVHNVYGYPYFKTGSIYQVMPAGLQARTFQVNYLNLTRTGSSQTRVSSGQITQSDSDSSSESISSSIDTKSTADFWSELQSAILGLIGDEDGRKVVIQPQASVVVVVAMADELRQVEEYLTMIHSNLQRQVVIEAKIIEVSLDDGYQTGINWAAMTSSSSGNGVVLGQSGGSSSISDGSSSSSVSIDSLTGDISSSLDTSTFGGVFSMALNFGDFTSFIELLESQGDVQVLSSPRISTVNNQKAVIKVGSDEYFVTDVSSETSSGTTTTTTSDITLTPFFSGIALDVTPQIDESGQITLHVHPTISEVEDQTKEFEVSGESQSLPLAYSTVRESDSVVHARSGQLVVIGGLMAESTTTSESGIPLLSDLPLLGSLFKHTLAESSKSELVILLRLRVINGPEDWQRSIDASSRRIEKLAPEMKNDWRTF
jgi:MSHA biogenesis protein MshL